MNAKNVMNVENVMNMQKCELENMFLAAKARGFMKPTLRTEDFIFSLAPATGKNPDAVYVVDRVSKVYIGKIKNNWFQPGQDYKDSPQARNSILSAMATPRAEALKYGTQSGQCSICGKPLTNKVSIYNKIGPICAEKMGFPISFPLDMSDTEIDMDMI